MKDLAKKYIEEIKYGDEAMKRHLGYGYRKYFFGAMIFSICAGVIAGIWFYKSLSPEKPEIEEENINAMEE